MKVTAEPDWLDLLSKPALNSLSRTQDRNRVGSSVVLTTPFMEDVSDDDVREWVDTNLDWDSITPKLKEIEDENLSKLGPRSIAVPWSERKDSLYSYFKHDSGPELLKSNVNGRLRPMSLESVKKKLIPSSNSGLPYMERKSNVLKSVSEDDLINENNPDYPCVLFTRTSEQKKTRNVWGYPIVDTILEGMFLYPYLEFEKNLSWRAALLGPDHTDSAIYGLINRSKSTDDVVVCVDFSSFDATVSPYLASLAFTGVLNAFQSKHVDELSYIYRRFAEIPIYTPDGEVSGWHGVPSGSTFTNTIDSLAQAIAAGEIMELQKTQIQGDDGVYIIPKGEVDTLYSSFRKWGLDINEDKSETFDDPQAVYLQRYYHPNYKGGVYSVARALNRIKYLESWTDFEKIGIDGSDFFALRAIMILENCKHHPDFVKLVKYVQSLDRNGLSYSNTGLKAYSSALESKARAGIFNQTDLRSGLELFETIKILRS